MADFAPVTEENKQEWIDFLDQALQNINGRFESSSNAVFRTTEGDIATAKNLVGTFLATITNQIVTID